MTRGKVVLVAFPFDDLTTEKARPAICLTEPLGAHRHVVLAFITSRQPEDPLATDIVLDSGDPTLRQTGLHVRSTIRAHRLLKVSTSLIKRELGSLSLDSLEQVSRAVRGLFERTDAATSESAGGRNGRNTSRSRGCRCARRVREEIEVAQ
jgi:mRNA interferase MazF